MFFLHCMIKILTDEKFLVELMNWLRNRFIFCNSIHRAIWWVNKNDESILFFLIFLLEKAAFDLLVFCFITAWFSLDMSGETNSCMSLVCSPVCWDWFVYWWYDLLHHDHWPAECRYNFLWHMFFINNLLYCFTWSTNQYILLGIFFLFPQTSLLMSSKILSCTS